MEESSTPQPSSQDTQTPKSSASTPAPQGFHPGFGCLIFLILLAIAGGIVGWSLYTLIKQNEALEAHCQQEPQSFPTPPQEEQAASLAYAEKIYAHLQKQDSPLRIDTSQLNALLHALPEAVTLRPVLRFTEIDTEAQTILADLAMPLNKMPWEGGSHRYLNGQAAFTLSKEPHPKNERNEEGSVREIWMLRCVKITSPHGPLPEEFIRGMQHYNWLPQAQEEQPLPEELPNLQGWRELISNYSKLTLSEKSIELQR